MARIYPPAGTGPGTGKAFFIVFGYPDRDADRDSRAWALHHLGDDVAALQAAGYQVVVLETGSREGLEAAIRSSHEHSGGAQTAGILWDGHGLEDGSLETSDGKSLPPEELAPECAAAPGLELVILTTCHTGKHVARWQKALGPRVKIVAWGGVLLVERLVDFMMPDDASTMDLDDLLRKHLGVRAIMPDGPLLDMLAQVSTATPDLRGAVKEASWRLNSFPTLRGEREVHAMHVRVGRNEDPAAHMPYATIQWGGLGMIDLRIDVMTDHAVDLRQLPRGGFTLLKVPEGLGVRVQQTVSQRPTGARLAELLQQLADHAAVIRGLIGGR